MSTDYLKKTMPLAATEMMAAATDSFPWRFLFHCGQATTGRRLIRALTPRTTTSDKDDDGFRVQRLEEMRPILLHAYCAYHL